MTTPPAPRSSPRPPASAAPSSGPAAGGGNFWTRKLGPFPGWVWVSLIGATGAVGWYLWKQHQNAADATAAAATTTAPGPDAATTDQTDFAGQIAALQTEIQDLEGQQSTPTGGGPPPPVSPPPTPAPGAPDNPHAITKDQAQYLLARHHTVYTLNTTNEPGQGAYVPVTNLTGVKVQLYTGDRAWVDFLNSGKVKGP